MTYTYAETLRMQFPSAHEQRAFAGMHIAVIDAYERAVGPARERHIAAQIVRVPLWNAYISGQSNLPVPDEIDQEAETAELEFYRISADAWSLAVAAGAETATTTARFPVEAGYLTAVPCYESHKRGKNWAATLTIDPSSPGGLGRNFLARGRGEYFYNVQDLTPGTPVEFGGDYYTGSGGKRAHRFYGVVTEITAEFAEFAEYTTGNAAVKAATAFRAERMETPACEYAGKQVIFATCTRCGTETTYRGRVLGGYTHPTPDGAPVLLWERRSSNGRWGVQIIGAETERELFRRTDGYSYPGKMVPLGTGAGMTVFRYDPTAQGRVVVEEDAEPLADTPATVIIKMDLQSNSFVTLLACLPGGRWQSFGYKRRSSSYYELLNDGTVANVPAFVILSNKRP